MSDIITKRVVVHGLVQGVGYRYAMVAEATRLALHGWVRNRRDGTVEAIVRGNSDEVYELLEWASKGPPAARVDDIRMFDADEGDLPWFETRPTA